MQPLIGLTLDDLQHIAAECSLPKFAGRQMADWLYSKRVHSIQEMTNLSKKARDILSENYCIGLHKPLSVVRSSDGTTKYLFPGCNGRNIETVMIPDRDRATLCVSSQAGCRMGCKFCMTGRQGFHGNLSSSDIINQIMSVEESNELTNIVFMGMGEPLDNFDAVLKSIMVLTEPWGFAWSPKRITVSTIGRPKELRRLLDETKVHIAISVHQPYPEKRAEIMPIEKAYPLAETIDLLRRYDFAHQRRLSIEYTMWDGINDDRRHADQLSRIIRGTNARVNLIRYHAIPGFEGQPSSEAHMVAFRDRLNELGITATIRASRGEDIFAACGMLSGVPIS